MIKCLWKGFGIHVDHFQKNLMSLWGNYELFLMHKNTGYLSFCFSKMLYRFVSYVSFAFVLVLSVPCFYPCFSGTVQVLAGVVFPPHDGLPFFFVFELNELIALVSNYISDPSFGCKLYICNAAVLYNIGIIFFFRTFLAFFDCISSEYTISISSIVDVLIWAAILLKIVILALAHWISYCCSNLIFSCFLCLLILHLYFFSWFMSLIATVRCYKGRLLFWQKIRFKLFWMTPFYMHSSETCQSLQKYCQEQHYLQFSCSYRRPFSHHNKDVNAGYFEMTPNFTLTFFSIIIV